MTLTLQANLVKVALDTAKTADGQLLGDLHLQYDTMLETPHEFCIQNPKKNT